MHSPVLISSLDRQKRKFHKILEDHIIITNIAPQESTPPSISSSRHMIQVAELIHYNYVINFLTIGS